MPQIVSARYDSHSTAMQSVWALHAAGLPLRDIAVVSLDMQPRPALSHGALCQTSGLDAEPFDAQSWWEGYLEALLKRRLTPEALRAYTSVIRSGGYLTLAHGTAELANTARRVLGQFGGRAIELRVSSDEDLYDPPICFPAPDFAPVEEPNRRRG